MFNRRLFLWFVIGIVGMLVVLLALSWPTDVVPPDPAPPVEQPHIDPPAPVSHDEPIATTVDTTDALGDPLNLSCLDEQGKPKSTSDPADLVAGYARSALRRSSEPRVDESATRWLTAAFAGDPSNDFLPNAERLSAALDRDPDYTLALWHAFTACHRQPDLALCARHQPGRRLAELDSDNSEYWSLVAMQRHRDSDRDGALEALQRAAGATRSSSYFPETVELLFNAQTAGNAALRWSESMGMVAALPSPRFTTLFRLCAEEYRREERRQACRQYGERLETQGRTLMQEKLGLALQQKVAKEVGDHEAALAARARSEAIDTLLRTVPTGLGFVPDSEVFDDAFFRGFAQNFATHGEGYAMREAMRDFKEYENQVRSGERPHPCPELRPAQTR